MAAEINRNLLIANALTLGNGVCGFYALTVLFKVDIQPGGGPLDFDMPAAFSTAAWLILLGMVFDVFDGKVARMAGGASTLGAQLDSFSDLVTFGLVPAVLMIRLNAGQDLPWQRVAWFFSLAYFLGALLRLARFTAESGPEEEDHIAFKGLPSPGAAGCVASLVIFYRYVTAFRAPELGWIARFASEEAFKDAVSFVPPLLPCFGLVLGFTMVSSRLRFPHVGSLLFNRKYSFDLLVYMIFAGILVAVIPEVVFPLVFLGYLFAMPVAAVRRYLGAHRRPQVADE
jgi:CDP-diacylglycerol--serine O-phosphatidyltransferase